LCTPNHGSARHDRFVGRRAFLADVTRGWPATTVIRCSAVASAVDKSAALRRVAELHNASVAALLRPD